MILAVLMLLIYLVVGAMTILYQRSRLFDVFRIIAGVAFLLLTTTLALAVPNPDGYLIFALALSLFISVEITSYKEYKGDRNRLFLIHAFTLMISAVLILMLLTA
ncbi:hypothetical protein GCM10022378_07650 [Salinicoccus jeotgali]|uniref:DUF1516 domain-containing protein n=1 Tax=Salinicoccus jeotgali TaxID=381634 RepID=A0ABP7EPL1_9STAP